MKSEYTPAYRRILPLTLPRLEEAIEDLRATYSYAMKHEDVLVLDELFCQLVSLEHRIVAWDRNKGETPVIKDSLAIVERALKWAWLARDEEKQVHGLYAEKLRDAVAAFTDLHVVLVSREQPVPPHMVAEDRTTSMTRADADALANMIKTRLPRAEVEVSDDIPNGCVVVARNPQRGTSQTFRNPAEFEVLMQKVVRQ